MRETFFRGAARVPLPPFASKQPNVRYVHLHDNDELDEDFMERWIRQAAALPGEPLF